MQPVVILLSLPVFYHQSTDGVSGGVPVKDIEGIGGAGTYIQSGGYQGVAGKGGVIKYLNQIRSHRQVHNPGNLPVGQTLEVYVVVI